MIESFAKVAWRFAAAGAVAGAVALTLASGPAAADDWRGRRDWNDRGRHHHHHWDRGRHYGPPVYYAPPPRPRYYAPPPVTYYAPPPVYYGAPSFGLNFVVPLR